MIRKKEYLAEKCRQVEATLLKTIKKVASWEAQVEKAFWFKSTKQIHRIIAT